MLLKLTQVLTFALPFLLQAKRTADCVSLCYVDLCVLTSADFKAVVKDFPHSARVLKVGVVLVKQRALLHKMWFCRVFHFTEVAAAMVQ